MLIGPAAAMATTITESGSTTIAPLAAKLARKYHRLHSTVSFSISQGGSDVGVDDVAHSRVDIGNSSRDPKPTDPGGLTWYKIARASGTQDAFQKLFMNPYTVWS